MSVFMRLLVELESSLGILFYPIAVLVALAQKLLGPGVVLLGGLLKPLGGLGVIHLCADALIVAEPQVALSPGVSRFGAQG